MYFSRGFVFGVFLQIRSVLFFLQQYSNTASQCLTETRLQQKAGLISRCQSELRAVHSLGLLWMEPLMWFLLGDHTAATQPLGSSPAGPRCAWDSPGARLPEGLLARPTSTRAKVKSARSLPGELHCWYVDIYCFTDGKSWKYLKLFQLFRAKKSWVKKMVLCILFSCFF